MLTTSSYFFSACKSSSPIVTSKKTELKKRKIVKGQKKTNRQTEELVEKATENLGAKYKYGGTTAAGFDCSGLVYHVFELQNITLPRNSYLQSLVGTVLDPNRDEIQKET
jgi:cell wall-associated NlpC family hydrolase